VRHSGAHINGQVGKSTGLIRPELEARSRNPARTFLSKVDAVLFPAALGTWIEGKIQVSGTAGRTEFLFGHLLGMQLAVVEYARQLVGLAGAHTTEAAEMASRKKVTKSGGLHPARTDRHYPKGKDPCGWEATILCLRKNASRQYYKSVKNQGAFFATVYEVNPEYVPRLEKAGMYFQARSGRLNMQVMELPDHPYFMGCQFHPELTSKLEEPAPCSGS